MGSRTPPFTNAPYAGCLLAAIKVGSRLIRHHLHSKFLVSPLVDGHIPNLGESINSPIEVQKKKAMRLLKFISKDNSVVFEISYSETIITTTLLHLLKLLIRRYRSGRFRIDSKSVYAYLNSYLLLIENFIIPEIRKVLQK